LGKDVLLLRKFEGREGISRLFRFNLDLLSEHASIPFKDVVGQRATIAIELADNSHRYINGFISRFAQSGRDERFTHYRAELVPWLWFLTRTSDCRIFQNQTISQIIEEVLHSLAFADFKLKLQGTFPKREYCVQYNETDYNFVARLMEQYGIFYFFEHSEDKHSLVLANSPGGHQPCPKQPKVIYTHQATGGDKEDVIRSWQIEHEFKPGKYAVTDFNFKTPNLSLAAVVTTAAAAAPAGSKAFEMFEYPGEYEQKTEGETIAKTRIEEEEAARVVVAGESDCRTFVSGCRFDLAEHFQSEMNQPYVLTEVQHIASVGSNYSGGAGGIGETYMNHFTCIPLSSPFRPTRLTPKPVIQGPQTAIVSGPAGEEINTDEYGRVKVQFPWDREGKADDNSSCWIRVVQAWAGKGWGSIWLPRIGQEVIVEFLEGDPDRPVITGSLYNAVQMPPYTLPGGKTKSTIKSYSSKGGGGFNEIRFDDAKGKEQVFIHAERNHDLRIKKDLLEFIGNEAHRIVGTDEFMQIKGDQHLDITGDCNQRVNGTVSLKAAMDLQQKVGMKFGLDAGTEVHIKSGMNLVIESGVNLTLKVGGNFINLNPAGVFVSGTMVMINSGGAAGSGSGCSPQAPKPPTEADMAKPGEKAELRKPDPPPKPTIYSPAALVLKQAAVAGTPFCEICERNRQSRQ
jgi:type VI secretion system secreted protein VgrG